MHWKLRRMTEAQQKMYSKTDHTNIWFLLEKKYINNMWNLELLVYQFIPILLLDEHFDNKRLFIETGSRNIWKAKTEIKTCSNVDDFII